MLRRRELRQRHNRSRRYHASINLAFVQLTIRRWWYICAPVGIILASLGIAIVWFTFVPMYKSVGYLRIEAVNPFLVYEADARNVPDLSERFVRTQLELITSPIVLEHVVEQKEVASIPEIRVHG